MKKYRAVKGGIVRNDKEGQLVLYSDVNDLLKALEEIRLNHAQPHRQRKGCRKTVTICDEALAPTEDVCTCGARGIHDDLEKAKNVCESCGKPIKEV